MSERVPDFLIIGAMKSGTTTLFYDLELHPRVFFPVDKEPGNLLSDAVLTPAGRAAYAKLFEAARGEQVCGEASTAYTKLPDYPGVVERAVRVCGPGLRVIYIVREPMARIRSHHRHESIASGMEPDLNAAVRDRPELLNWSRYAMQLEPWVEALSPQRVHVMVFERYTKDRKGEAARAERSLGLEPAVEGIDESKVANRWENVREFGGVKKKIMFGNPVYQAVRPLIPRKLRYWVSQKLLPTPKDTTVPATPETEAWVREQLRDDMARFRALAGRLGVPGAESLWP